MSKKTRALSLLLAVLLTFTLFPAAAFAVGEEQLPQDTMETIEPQEIPYVPEMPAEEVQGEEELDAGGIGLMSLLPPADTYNVTLDLSGKTEAQLKAVPVSEMLASMSVTQQVYEKVAWGYWIEEYEYYPGYTDLRLLDDTYHVVQPTDTIDMRPVYSGSTYSFDFLVGKGTQLDYSAVKYNVTVSVTQVPESNGISASLYTDGGTRTKLYPLTNNYGAGEADGVWTYYLEVPTNYPLTEQYNLGLYWRDSYYESEYGVLDVNVYAGHKTLEEIGESAADVTDLWASDISASGGHKAVYDNTPQDFTLVFSKGATKLAAQPVSIVSYPLSSRLAYMYYKYNSNEDYQSVYDTTEELSSYVMSQTGNVLKFRFTDGASGTIDNTKITSVTIDGTDITSAATGSGYTISDLSSSKTVVVVADGATYTLSIPKVTPPSEEEWQDIGSSDTYFNINGATGLSNYFIVPYEHDTYFYNGYQTVLINATNTDLTQVAPNWYPTFGTGPDMYANGVKQMIGTSTQDFSAGRVQYTAKATNNTDLKNYKVAFVNKTETNANLFVNGPLGNGAGGSNERYIRFDNYYGKKHDIFIANTGEAELSGLNVTLTGAQHIKLDDWYTVGGTDNEALNAFTKTGSIGYTSTGIDSAAKIRLVPDGDGDISGTLTISATGITPVVINLTGKAGNPKINTTQAQIDAYPAVKYVPYSFLVTTDNEYDWTTVRFSCSSGQLPPGLTLRQNGEIYGIPITPGTYTFTVAAEFNGRVQFPADSKSYTITVLDNTDANVDRTVDSGYSIQVRVPATVNTTSDREFKIEGALAEFMNFYLDGNKMTVNTDYTVVDGSTKITIKAQTFNNAGAGTHTIAAEFRVNGDATDVMKRAAQNTTVQRGTSDGGEPTPKPTPKPSPSPSPRPSSSPSSSPSPTTSPTSSATPGPIKPVTKVFVDVPENMWYVKDVQWAYDNGYMVGTTGSKFEPDSKQTEATIFSVLARLADVNLYNYTDKTAFDIKAGEWYTNAAQWAKSVGLMVKDFNAGGTVPRGDMAVILVKYFKWMGVDIAIDDKPIVIADAELMTPEQLEAFTILYKIGIFSGISDTEIRMNPQGKTTRAEFSALLRRVGAYIDTHKKA